MTESCHFNDKNSLGGSFCIWKGGSIMATTRIMPLHVGKGCTESRAISDIIDYVANPQKTDNGRLITGFACDSSVSLLPGECKEDMKIKIIHKLF